MKKDMETRLMRTGFEIPVGMVDRWIFSTHTVAMQVRRKGRKTVKLEWAYRFNPPSVWEQKMAMDWLGEAMVELARRSRGEE